MRTANCVRQGRDREGHDHREVATRAWRDGGSVKREHRPEEGGVRDDLGHQEGRERHPGNAHAEQRHDIRQACIPGHPPCEQKRRNARGAHDERIQHVSVQQRRRDERVMEQRCKQQRVQLVHVPDQLAVDARQRRMAVRDADRKPFVEQLVRHHVPVGDAARQHGETAAEPKPQRGYTDIRAIRGGDGGLRTGSGNRRRGCQGCLGAEPT